MRSIMKRPFCKPETLSPEGIGYDDSVSYTHLADDGRGALVARDREATSLYILPGYEFHVVDALITNFHVPRSTLMMLDVYKRQR